MINQSSPCSLQQAGTWQEERLNDFYQLLHSFFIKKTLLKSLSSFVPLQLGKVFIHDLEDLFLAEIDQWSELFKSKYSKNEARTLLIDNGVERRGLKFSSLSHLPGVEKEKRLAKHIMSLSNLFLKK
jgi:hypothetical protein